MSGLNLDNYSSLNQSQLAETTSKYPIYVQNQILEDFVFWTPKHISMNSFNAITDRYNQDHEKAQSTRLNKIISKFRDKIETARLIKDNTPTLFKIHVSDFTLTGKREQEIYSEFLNVNINNEDQTIYLISTQALAKHEHFI